MFYVDEVMCICVCGNDKDVQGKWYAPLVSHTPTSHSIHINNKTHL